MTALIRWPGRRQLRRWRRALALLVVAPLAGAALVAPQYPAGAQQLSGGVDAPTDSAVTVSGRADGVYGDNFSALRVTVSQTRNLTSQGISISWTGGKPTVMRDATQMVANYLQIMQCWGPDPAAVDFRETCVQGFGRPGGAVNRIPKLLVPDPLETVLSPDAKIIPFLAVTGERSSDGSECDASCNVGALVSDYFRADNTNEIYQGFTAADGTGRVVFEVQNAIAQPYLGCGAPQSGPGGRETPRPCSLVVVPRGDHDLDGSPLCGTCSLVDSPLQASTFRDRIVIPLQFESLGGGCELGAEERLTVGSDLVADAVRSWQPALCADGGATFGYSAASDEDAIRQVLSPVPGAPGMGFTAEPAVPLPGGPEVRHAPVVISGAVIAFNIDAEVDVNAPPEVLKLRATALRELKLTPRLVAKLLTQSYSSDVPGGFVNEHVRKNPRDLFQDRELRSLNPVFAQFSQVAALRSGLMVAQGNSAAYREVWKWILADATARKWLAGEPDEYGMVVNHFYRDVLNTGVPLDTFPKADATEVVGAGAPEDKPFGTGHLRPYLGSMEEAALQTRRADPKSKTVWDATRTPPDYVAGGAARPVGFRGAMSITDAASAARYGLYAASLINQNQEFVAPTRDGMLAAVDAMVPSEADDDVLMIDPAKKAPGAYPLTMVNYAAVNISNQDQAARDDYAQFLRYAAGAGQTEGVRRGELPRGYLPLTNKLRQQTMLAANAIERGPTPSPTPSVEPTEPETTTPTSASTTPAGTPNSGLPPVTPGPTRTPAPVPPATAVSQTTPGGPLGLVGRYALVAALALGLLGGAAGPVLLRLSGRRRV
ncbi:hypothetical protein ACIBF5_08530 [Micromonospora sp. NPDC050417]|uniref:hypothetical protein n=1 Tax=Micromonospora sp. NPDC050417 TaxID=3364280 RepID=UPI0037B4A6EA